MTTDVLEAAGARTRRSPAQGERPLARRGWVIVGLVVAAGVTLIALVHSSPAPQYLNPGSVGPTGTHALADVLGELGRRVQTETSVPAAVTAATAKPAEN